MRPLSRRMALGLSLPAALGGVAYLRSALPLEPARSVRQMLWRLEIKPTWHGTVEGSLSEGRSSRMPVLFFFWASWDCAGKELERDTFLDPRVNTLLYQDFICAGIDCSDDEVPWVNLAKEQFKVVGIPTIVIVTPERDELLRFNEYVKPRTFVDGLRHARQLARDKGYDGHYGIDW